MYVRLAEKGPKEASPPSETLGEHSPEEASALGAQSSSRRRGDAKANENRTFATNDRLLSREPPLGEPQLLTQTTAVAREESRMEMVKRVFGFVPD